MPREYLKKATLTSKSDASDVHETVQTILADIEAGGQVAFRYTADTNPNGSLNNIAGIVNKAGNVLGMMPHPENLIEPAHGGSDGRALFESALGLVDA